MVNIELHDNLGVLVGRSKWTLAVKSVSEGLRAINVLTGGKFFKILHELGQEKFEIVINGKKFQKTSNWEEKLDKEETYNEIKNSEVCFQNKGLKTIDIVPVIQASDSDALLIALGVLLIIIGIVALIAGGSGTFLIIAGIGLIATGVINLLATPPKFDDFREIEQGGRRSYLFNGPQNTIREGGPVPVGYGRLIVGSQTISASYDITNVAVVDSLGAYAEPYGLMAAYNVGGGRVGYFKGGVKSINPYTYTSAYVATTSSSIDVTSVGSGPEEIYKTCFYYDAGNFSVSIDLGDALDPETQESRFFKYKLHFSEPFVNGAAQRVFNVSVNGNAEHNNIDIFTLAGGKNKSYVIKSNQSIALDSEGKAVFTFVKVTENPLVCAIEIFRDEDDIELEGNLQT